MPTAFLFGRVYNGHMTRCFSVLTAVRFGRVPKKEKAKILEQMKRVNAQSQLHALDVTLHSDPDFVSKIVTAHLRNSDFTHDKTEKLVERAWANPEYIDCPAHMVSTTLTWSVPQ